MPPRVEDAQLGGQQAERDRGEQAWASPAPRAAGQLIVPSSGQFALIRAEAKAAGTLSNLQRMVAAWQAVAEKCDLAFAEVLRLAVFRLEVERDLGVHLAQTVHRGGNRSKSPRATLLPDGVTKKQSAAYQKLAAIPDEVFRAYIEKAKAAGTLPSSAGARRSAWPQAPRKSRGMEIPSP
jgi:hypothetical protein